MKKSNPRLRFRLTSNFANHEKSAVSSLGLVEGNSTITVNTVGDTDESSTDKKGIDIITTTFNDTTKEVSIRNVMLRIFTSTFDNHKCESLYLNSQTICSLGFFCQVDLTNIMSFSLIHKYVLCSCKQKA